MIIVGVVLTIVGTLLAFFAGKAIMGRFARREVTAIKYKLKFRPAPPAERYRIKPSNQE